MDGDKKVIQENTKSRNGDHVAEIRNTTGLSNNNLQNEEAVKNTKESSQAGAEDGKQSSILSLLKIIVSSKTKAQQQTELVECLNTNPDILTTILKHSFNADEKAADNDRAAELCKTISSTAQAKTLTFKSEGELEKKKNRRRSKAKESTVHDAVVKKGKMIKNQIYNSKECLYVNEKNIKRKHPDKSRAPIEIKKRVTTRKNESDDVSDDFTRREHFSLRREPKRRKKVKSDITQVNEKQYAKLDATSTTMSDITQVKGKQYAKLDATSTTMSDITQVNGKQYAEQDATSTTKSGKADSSADTAIVKIAKNVLTLLTHPSSREQQMTIIGLLKSDPNLLRAFLKEKERQGTKTVIIFVPRRNRKKYYDNSQGSINIKRPREFLKPKRRGSDASIAGTCSFEKQNKNNSVSAQHVDKNETIPEINQNLKSLMIRLLQSNSGFDREDSNIFSTNSSQDNTEYPCVSKAGYCGSIVPVRTRNIASTSTYPYPTCSTSSHVGDEMISQISSDPVSNVPDNSFETSDGFQTNGMFNTPYVNISLSQEDAISINSSSEYCSNITGNECQLRPSFATLKPVLQHNSQHLAENTEQHEQFLFESSFGNSYENIENTKQSEYFKQDNNVSRVDCNSITSSFSTDMAGQTTNQTQKTFVYLKEPKDAMTQQNHLYIADNECVTAADNLDAILTPFLKI